MPLFPPTSASANQVYAGPSFGSPSSMTPRALVPADLPQANAIASLYEDFLGNALGPFNSSVTGTGAAVVFTIADPGGHPGICQVQTGTSAAGTGGIGIGGTVGIAAIRLGAGAWVGEIDIRIPTLSDGTNRFTFFGPFNDNRAGTGTDAVMFRYVDNVNSGKFECVTRANGVETATDSGITVVANQFYKLRVEIDATASSVAFSIDGVLKATNTTNIPSGSGRETGVFIGIVQSLGATSRNLDIDYALLTGTLTTPR
jgi:hypothetical protein